jgi:hypothetical protein
VQLRVEMSRLMWSGEVDLCTAERLDSMQTVGECGWVANSTRRVALSRSRRRFCTRLAHGRSRVDTDLDM